MENLVSLSLVLLTEITSSYPGWIKSPHVVTLGSGLWTISIWGGGEGRWGVLPSQNSKCQNLPKFQFSGGGGDRTLRGVFCTSE